jgi:hypothetical protein
MDKLRDNPENQVCVHAVCAITYNAYYLSSRHLYQYVKQSQDCCLITHRLCSCIKDDVQYGYEALDWESILHGDA